MEVKIQFLISLLENFSREKHSNAHPFCINHKKKITHYTQVITKYQRLVTSADVNEIYILLQITTKKPNSKQLAICSSQQTSIELVNRYQILGTIPKSSYQFVLVTDPFDPSQSMQTKY